MKAVQGKMNVQTAVVGAINCAKPVKSQVFRRKGCISATFERNIVARVQQNEGDTEQPSAAFPDTTETTDFWEVSVS